MDRDLEDDILADAEIMAKILDDRYAQNVYASMCNMRWQPKDTWSVLKDEYWTVSWRAAGGIVAELQGKGTYIDWYCSGMANGLASGVDEEKNKGYAPEGTVTDEIRKDFARIGWHPSEWPND